jgi:hypothetical protein
MVVLARLVKVYSMMMITRHVPLCCLHRQNDRDRDRVHNTSANLALFSEAYPCSYSSVRRQCQPWHARYTVRHCSQRCPCYDRGDSVVRGRGHRSASLELLQGLRSCTTAQGTSNRSDSLEVESSVFRTCDFSKVQRAIQVLLSREQELAEPALVVAWRVHHHIDD